MRIGFDVSQTAEPMAGCGIVADQLLRHLVDAGPSHTFIPYPVFGHYRVPDYRRATRPAAPNVSAELFDRSWEALNAGWDSEDGDRLAFLGRPDVVHANNFFCPRDLPVPVVYTLYDLSHVERPDLHTEANRLVCFGGVFDASIYADHVVAMSQYSRATFLQWFPHVRPECVSVVYPAARPSLAGPIDEERVEAVLRAFSLTRDGFWLAVGTIEPRKNYGQLLEAYARLLAEVPSHRAPLCIVGQAGWIESSLAPRIRDLGLADRVRCLGFIADDELAVMYRSCFGFVYPSVYEGFGLPVVEALAGGAAVVASRATSLPEVVGDAGLLVEPGSVESLEQAMRRLVTEDECRPALRRAATRQAATFSWRGAAERVLEIYADVCAPRAGMARSRAGHGA